MTKLSKVQSKALLTIAQNELNELNGKRLSSYYGNKATYQVLNRAGLIQVTKTSVRDGSYEAMLLTDTGRKVAIDLLHEGADEEMTDALHYRDMETKRVAAEEIIQKHIVKTHGLKTWQVQVTASHKFLLDGYTYSITFNQFKGNNSDGSRRQSDYVRISHTHQDGYFIDTTSSSFLVSEAMRMAELMVIAGKVVMSNILSS